MAHQRAYFKPILRITLQKDPLGKVGLWLVQHWEGCKAILGTINTFSMDVGMVARATHPRINSDHSNHL